jgi:hypothetical protein
MTHTQRDPHPRMHESNAQLVVVGGGLAGTFAAIAAARLGTQVVLLQERPVLGGNSSSEVRVHPVGASQHGYHRDARETGLIEELFLSVRSQAYGLKQINGRHYPMWDVVLEDMVRSEPNVTLHLNTRVIDVEVEEDARDGYESRIVSLTAVQQGNEAVYRYSPEMVIDATGDGFVALRANAPFRYGREAASEFGETWAPEQPDDIVLGSTIMFAARDVGREVPFVAPGWAHEFPDEESLPFRNHEAFESGYWWLEWGGTHHTIHENEDIRRELQSAVLGVWDHIKNHCTVPGVRERAKTWTLDWIGHIPGKRESRRFEGDHILSERDIINGILSVPEDVVAFGGWAIDLHAPDGVYSADKPCTQPPLPDLYGIPLRSLYSRTVSNLMLAGRNISQSHVAHGSTRVMKTTSVIGEAAGVAASKAVDAGKTPRSLAGEGCLVNEVQQQLLRQGAYLPRLANTDPGDLVRRHGVSLTASSSAPLVLGEGQEMGWDQAGLSLAEHSGVLSLDEADVNGREIPLGRTHAQSVIIFSGRIERITLPLVNTGTDAIEAQVVVRQAVHLRDFGSLGEQPNDLATMVASIAPGARSVEFSPDEPILCDPNAPVVLIPTSDPNLAWNLTEHEPPGTQAAAWDDELGYWRWIHGTFGFHLEPVSHPFGPEQVVSGVTRPERAANVWISDPRESLPQHLTIVWPEPVEISTVQITFDSQLSGWIWEGMFPMIPESWRLEARNTKSGDWTPLVNETGNVQRRRVHQFPTVTTEALRLTILATHGGATARIVEVRAYGQERG